MSDFAGDLKLECGNDGGVLTITDGDFECDKGFSTAVYLSLFGGNFEDEGFTDTEKSWWGNIGESGNNVVRSQFQAFITAKPLTSKNLQAAKDAAMNDLQWLIDEGIADKIDIQIKATDNKTSLLRVEIKKNEQTLEACVYKAQWQAMM